MIDEFYDKVVVKTDYKGICGSGTLVQTESKKNSYLITAWHCMNKEDSIDLNSIILSKQEYGEMHLFSVCPKDALIIKQKDIVIIKLNYVHNIPFYYLGSVTVGNKVSITGFPRAFDNKKSIIKRYPLNASIVSIPQQNVIQLNSEQPIETLTQTAKDIMSNFSGSGIFKNVEDEFFLCGIITNLGSPDGAYGALCGITLSCIQKELKKNNWEPICDIEVSSFNLFKENVIEIFEEPMDRICSYHMPNIRKNIKPSDIKTRCGKKLVWPYSDTHLNCKKIWEGWLLYLIFRSIENKENLENESFYVVNNSKEDRKIKLIYVTNKTKLSDFLKDYLQKAYNDINKGDFLIIKTNKIPATMILRSSQIDKVITDVSNVISIEQEMRIDDVKSDIKKLSLIHIRKMVNELNLIVENNNNKNLDDNKLEKQLGQRIGEILNEF